MQVHCFLIHGTESATENVECWEVKGSWANRGATQLTAMRAKHKQRMEEVALAEPAADVGNWP